MFTKSMRPHSSTEAETWREQEVAPTMSAFDHRVGGEATPPVMVIAEPSALAGVWNQLDLFSEASRVRMSRWQASGPVYPASAAVSGMNSSGLCPSCGHDGARH